MDVYISSFFIGEGEGWVGVDKVRRCYGGRRSPFIILYQSFYHSSSTILTSAAPSSSYPKSKSQLLSYWPFPTKTTTPTHPLTQPNQHQQRAEGGGWKYNNQEWPLPLLPTQCQQPSHKQQPWIMMMMMGRRGGGRRSPASFFLVFCSSLERGEGDWRGEGAMKAPTSCFVFFSILALLILHQKHNSSPTSQLLSSYYYHPNSSSNPCWVHHADYNLKGLVPDNCPTTDAMNRDDMR